MIILLICVGMEFHFRTWVAISQAQKRLDFDGSNMHGSCSSGQKQIMSWLCRHLNMFLTPGFRILGIRWGRNLFNPFICRKQCLAIIIPWDYFVHGCTFKRAKEICRPNCSIFWFRYGMLCALVRWLLVQLWYILWWLLFQCLYSSSRCLIKILLTGLTQNVYILGWFGLCKRLSHICVKHNSWPIWVNLENHANMINTSSNLRPFPSNSFFFFLERISIE